MTWWWWPISPTEATTAMGSDSREVVRGKSASTAIGLVTAPTSATISATTPSRSRARRTTCPATVTLASGLILRSSCRSPTREGEAPAWLLPNPDQDHGTTRPLTTRRVLWSCREFCGLVVLWSRGPVVLWSCGPCGPIRVRREPHPASPSHHPATSAGDVKQSDDVSFGLVPSLNRCRRRRQFNRAALPLEVSCRLV